jgi:hypothetical protein
MKHIPNIRTGLAAVALAAALTLIAAPSGLPASQQLLSLGPVILANGTATLAGSVGSEAAGLSLTANGHPVDVDSNGAFAANVSLDGASTLDLALSNPATNEWTGFSIPLTGSLAGSTGVIPAGALDNIEQAGVSLITPIAGDDGVPLTVTGSVADAGRLTGLTLDGEDILGQVTSDRSFTVQVPGTTTTLTLVATDKQGVVENQRRQLTVNAANAQGIRITRVHFVTKKVIRRHRLRVTVTTKDRLGRLVVGARVSLTATKRGFLVKRPSKVRTGRHGAVTLSLPLKRTALSRRLVLLVVAKTPTAKARRKSGVALPPRRSHG